MATNLAKAKMDGQELIRKPSQNELRLTAPNASQPTAMEMIDYAVRNGGAIDVIERLAKLQREMMEMEAQREFNEALSMCQQEITRIAPDLQNPQTHSKYASYKAIDKAVRPVYTRYGLSLTFSTIDCPTAETIRVICDVSKGLHTKRYQVDMPADGKGAKGGDVMTKTHAAGSAMSYGMRYLIKAIFNIAIGEDDNDGNLSNGELAEALEKIADAGDREIVNHYYREAYAKFEENPGAIKAIVSARKTAYARLEKRDVSR